MLVSSRYVNPVIPRDTPDPHVLRVGDRWWLTATGGDPEHGAFPLYSSPDLVHWQPAGYVLDETPEWSENSYWAPELHRVGQGFVAYYTARDDEGMLRVGAATAPRVEGPYTDLGEPLVAEPDIGVIDPTFFKDDDGRQYLYWKEDGNACGRPSRLMACELDATGTRLVGDKVEVLRNDPKTWEGDIVEAPEVEKRGEFYYLFYSGNGYWGDAYAEGVARSKSPLGPFEKAPEPFLRSSGTWKGPGHAAITQDKDGDDWLVYHAWHRDHVGQQDPGRMVCLDPIEWKDGWPTCPGPSLGGAAP